jgi:HK97 family phage major capsid protein
LEWSCAVSYTSPQYARAEISRIYAHAQDRPLTDEEQKRIQANLEFIEQAARIEGRAAAIGGAATPGAFAGSQSDFGGNAGPGDLFVNSQEYKAIKASDLRPQRWSSGPVEVIGPSALGLKGTLLESNTGGPGGGLTPPFYQPGIVSKLLEPLGVADVFSQSQTTASQVRYIVEGTATNAAAGVAEAGLKPESTLGYLEVVEPIKKVATWVPASDELVEDAVSLSGYLNQRLTMFVRVEEERQILRGAGTNELVGIFGRSGINQYTKAAGDDNAVALAKVIANTAGSSFLEPDTVILHPSNWLSTRLLRDGAGGTVGQFYGGGPFTGAYGNPGQPGMFGASLWGKRVVLSNYCGPGTALVGNLAQGAHIWRRGGVSFEMTNAHEDFFRRNLVAMRSESRLGLGLYRPNAVTEVRGLT